MGDDLISRQAAIDTALEFFVEFLGGAFYENSQKELIARFQRLPSAQPEVLAHGEGELSTQLEITRCKDCKFYTPMNRETKTGICNLTMHQNFGDNWFCAGAERRTE